MAVDTQTVKVSVPVTWNRTRNTKTASIVRDGSNSGYTHTHVLESVHEVVSGMVEVTIDVHEVAQRVARRAVNTRSGKATLLERLIRARKMREKVERSNTETYAVPVGYSVVSEVRK